MGLAAYLRELERKPGISEVGLYTPFARHLVEDVLGYPPEAYHVVKPSEPTKPDLRLFDEDGSEWIVGEIKLDDQQIRSASRRRSLWNRQIKGKGYIRPETVYVVLVARHTIYVCDVQAKILAGAHFDSDHVYDVVANTRHPLTDRSLRLALHLVTREESLSRSRFARFRTGELKSGYIALDDASLAAFEETFQYATELLLGYARRAWDRLKAESAEFRTELADLDQRIEDWKDDPKTREILESRRRRLRTKHRLVLELFDDDYPEFKRRQAYAGTHTETLFEDIFLSDTVYVVLSRLLFVRLCEDLGFVRRKVSNGGLAVWRDFTTNIRDRYIDLLDVAFKDAQHVYTRLFERTVFDWYTSANGELDALLERILYRLNAFAFSRVDRDLLGQLYQRFLPAIKRKRLGEFYTDDEIVDYIIATIGIPADDQIATRRILDPACGSFTFGVRTIPHLLAQAPSLAAADQIDLVRRVLIGFDINPFATFIAQMNLLFALLALYKEAKAQDPHYRLPSFSVFSVNSLVRHEEGAAAPTGAPDTPETDLATATAYCDYVVGNPPYVRNERIPTEDRAAVEETFASIRHRNTDLAAYFIQRAIADWLKPASGVFGMVVSLGLANSASAAKLREFLRDHDVVEVASLEWMATELFQGTDVVPMLLFLRRVPQGEAEQVRRTPVRIVTGLRSKQDLRKAARDQRFRRAHTNAIRRNEWETLSPFGDWCLEVTPGDVPIIQKLRALPTVGSTGLARAHYGIKIGAQDKHSRLVISGEDPTPAGGDYLPFHKGDDICAFGISPASDLIDSRGLPSDSADTHPTAPRPADASIWSWWGGGGPEEVREGGQNSFGFHKREEPSDSCVAVVPGIYVTLVAGILNPALAAANNSTIVGVPLRCTAAALAAFINSQISRYYAFLVMRAGILLRRRSTVYPRAIQNLPCPRDRSAFDELGALGARAADLATLVATDEVDVFLREIASETDLMPAKLLPGADFSAWTEGDISQQVFLDAVAKGGKLHLGEGAAIAGDADLLLLLRCAARSLYDPVAPHELAGLQLPRDKARRARLAKAIRAHVDAIPGLRQEFQGIEGAIDELVMDALGLTQTERQHILERCQQFPLSETVSRPRYLWSEDRKEQARRRYESGERYR